MTNLYVDAGDDYELVGSDDRRYAITVAKAGVAQDLTGVTLKLLVKRRKTDADGSAVITKTQASGIAIASPQSGATKGVCYLSLDTADTASVTPGNYYWAMRAVDTVGRVTLVGGRFYLRRALVTT